MIYLGTRVIEVYRTIFMVNDTNFEKSIFIGYLEKRREEVYNVDGEKVRELIFN